MTDGHSATSALQNSSNPETLDEVVSTTSPRLWLALVSLVVLIVCGIAWAFFATIPVSVTARGVVEIQDGRLILPSPIDGAVTLLTQEQDTITEGQPLATVTPFGGGDAVTIAAPFDGEVTDLFVQNGSGVTTGQSMGMVSQPARAATVRVVAYVDPSKLPTFEVGDSVVVELSADASQASSALPGVVTSISDVPAQLTDLESNLVPAAAAMMIADAKYGLLYPIVVDVTSAPDALVNDGQVVSVVNTYEQVSPIEAIVTGMQ